MRADQLSSSIGLVFGAIIIYFSQTLGLGRLSNPGPGFVPFGAGIILCGFSIFVFFHGKIAFQKKQQKSIGQLWTRMNWSKVIIVIIGLSAYALTFNYIGYLASTAALLLVLLKTVDPVGWKEAIVESLIASIVTFVVFVLWLKVQLPRGIIESLFF